MQIINGQVDLFDIYKKKSYDELKGILEDWLNGDEGNNQETTPVKEQAASVGATSTDNIDKAFDDLFDQ